MRVSYGSPLADVPDDTVIDDWPTRLVKSKGVYLFNSSRQLRYLARGLLRLRYRQPPDAASLDDRISHEEEHAAAARAVGFTKTAYGFAPQMDPFGVIPYPLGVQLFMHPLAPSRPVTKLGLATILAAPASPSPGDLAQLQAMGYQGAADVAARVKELALRTGIRLPVPASAAVLSATDKALQHGSLTSLEFPVANPLAEGAQRPPTSGRAATSRRRASWISRSPGRHSPH